MFLLSQFGSVWTATNLAGYCQVAIVIFHLRKRISKENTRMGSVHVKSSDHFQSVGGVASQKRHHLKSGIMVSVPSDWSIVYNMTMHLHYLWNRVKYFRVVGTIVMVEQI